MLTIPGQKIPRKIAIKVAKAEKLKETKKEGKNKVCNKFKVIVLGGKNKESSTIETSVDGNVQWRFSCIIKLHRNQKDPLVVLVEDSDGNHKGQVIIPIVKIASKPYTFNASQDPANSNNILCSELEPTNKCNNPSGFLLYWVWIEECFTEEQLGKKSFNKSMSSLFGSKGKLSSSKTNLEVKNRDSISNFGSHSNLNKPEKHPKSSSFLNLKIGGKKKSKPRSSDCRITPDSSDIESSSNFSFNPSNPFDNDPDFVKNDRVSIKNGSLTEEDGVSKKLNKYPKDSYNITKPDIPNNGNSDLQFSIKSGDNNNPFGDGIASTIMPPYTSQNVLSDQGLKQSSKNLVPSVLPNKYNTVKDFSIHREPIFNNDSTFVSPKEIESTYRPGHNKSALGSDYSMFSQYSNSNPAQSITKANNDESDNIKKENSELKLMNNRLALQINDLTNELESVKQTLCKLRLKLLDQGATQFLEI